MQLAPLYGEFGAEITGLDLRTRPDDAAIAAIAAALYQHSLVCIRGQDLTPTELQAFGARFGTVIEHVEADLLLDGARGVMSLSNADGRPERQRNGGAFWHTDLVFTEEPASITMLRAVEVPARGGETRFADQYAAYDALSEATKARFEAIEVEHCYEGRRDGSMPTVVYPLVRRHPVTGRKALYGATGTCIGAVGLKPPDAERILAEAGAHAMRPEFVHAHAYRPDDLVLWDNAATLHCGPQLEEAEALGTARVMHRVSVRGWHPGDAN
jgi:alpha-ketoglutarate-dependent taurine dioxygenase